MTKFRPQRDHQIIRCGPPIPDPLQSKWGRFKFNTTLWMEQVGNVPEVTVAALVGLYSHPIQKFVMSANIGGARAQ